jgi:hypothetical protein
VRRGAPAVDQSSLGQQEGVGANRSGSSRLGRVRCQPVDQAAVGQRGAMSKAPGTTMVSISAF